MNPTLTTILLTISGLLAATWGWNTFWAAIERRTLRLRMEVHRQLAAKQWANRPRARIVQIGTITQDEQGNPLPTNFHLNPNSNGKFVPEIMVGPDGEIAWGGYTRDELLEIARRRKEFEP